jgi:extracellular elastinolytic metalloproteinase
MRRATLGSLVLVSSLAVAILVVGLPSDAATPAPPVAATAAPPAVGKPLGEAAVAIARHHVAAHEAEFGLSDVDVSDLRLSSWVPSESNGLTNVYLQQRVKGIDVFGAMLNVAVRSDGSVFRVASSAVAGAAEMADTATPAMTDVQAARSAAQILGLPLTSSLASRAQARGADRERVLGDGGISQDPITAHLVYDRDGKGLRLTWELGINELDAQHWWAIRIDAGTGEEVSKNDWVADDNHDVYPFPVESPSFGGRSVLTNPANLNASPYGWNDTNGVAGPEATTTNGNNVNAYTDVDANNVPDAASSPDGGGALNFDFPLDLSQPPSAYRPAAVSNLYYANNRIHDVLYRFGFNEAAGNFQVNNYGRGGTGSDAVNAEAQDGSGMNNANFGTPPDGQPPRMQMYLWNTVSPNRDGDLDNGVIVHEYGHGVSNRLTGGPANVNCLTGNEQAGEGWSDYYSYMLTMPNGTEPAGGRGIGTYVLNQATNGPGIRNQKYSTSTGINTETYDTIKAAGNEHAVGEVWAEMLWEMTWPLIGRYGFTADLINGNAGNTRSLQLVTDGLKLQPCNPGFVDARDAILAADDADYGGADHCLIWTAFAKRGLGYSATQGSVASNTDGTQAFDLPPNCLGPDVTRSTTPNAVPAQRQMTYGFHIANRTELPGGLTGVSVTGGVGQHVGYVPGSATCGGTYDGGTRKVTFPIGSLAPGAAVDCQFQVVADASPWTINRFADDFEPDMSAWAAAHGAGTATDWALGTTDSHSPSHSAFGSDIDTVSDKYLTLPGSYVVAAGDELSFWQRRTLEYANTVTGYDGGVVEVSTNGGASWSDIGAGNWVQNGYSHTIDNTYGNPLGNRPAFSGIVGWVQSIADLTPYAGQTVRVRFRLGTDNGVGAPGWWVDDVSIDSVVRTVSTSTADATGAPTQNSSLKTLIAAPQVTVPDAPAVTGSTPASGAVTTTFTSGFDGSSPITGYTAECVSTDGGVTGAAAGNASPLTVTGLSAAKSYHCRVKAANVAGESAFSAFGPTVVTPAAPVVPTTTVPGRPVIKKVAVPSSGLAKVKFKAPSTGGSPILKYQASCKSKDGGTTRKGASKKSPVTVKKLTGGAHYTCKVRAKNSKGWGQWSKHSKKFVLPGKPKGREVTFG